MLHVRREFPAECSTDTSAHRRYLFLEFTARFGDKYSFAKRAPTSYQSGKGTGEFYPLETLAFWVQWEQQHPEQQGFSAYFQAARKQQAGNVAVADRQVCLTEELLSLHLQQTSVPLNVVPTQDLKDFLTGLVQSSQYIRQPEINLTGLPLQQEVRSRLITDTASIPQALIPGVLAQSCVALLLHAGR